MIAGGFQKVGLYLGSFTDCKAPPCLIKGECTCLSNFASMENFVWSPVNSSVDIPLGIKVDQNPITVVINNEEELVILKELKVPRIC